MLHLSLNLDVENEKKLLEIVEKDFGGSYEDFIESAIRKHDHVLMKLLEISEDLGIEDLSVNHDHYLYGSEK